jgi:hypothetical protein
MYQHVLELTKIVYSSNLMTGYKDLTVTEMIDGSKDDLTILVTTFVRYCIVYVKFTNSVI